jgi:adenylosuccinate synthase
MDNLKRCTVVVGAQWGDEGKGKIVDVLAAHVDIVARYQGGANAGHTVDVGGEEFILHQIPSGILHPGKRCLLGNGVVLDLEQFFAEMDGLEARGDGRRAPGGRQRAGPPAPGLPQAPRSGQRAAAGRREDRHHRQGHRAGLRGQGGSPGTAGGRPPRPGAREDLLRHAAAGANERLAAAGGDPVDPDELVRSVLAARERLLPLVTDTGREIHDAITGGRRVLLEGAQGALLDVDHGTYPFVTSSNTTAAGAATGTGIGPTALESVLGVVKAYTTRVGSGPLPTEIPAELGERLRELGGEYGATTGRPRRCGWFDGVVVRYAARVNGLTGLALTKLDVLDSFEEIRICTGYLIDGEHHEDFPDDLARLQRAEPILETLPGWKADTSRARSLDDVPARARDYLHRIEALVAVPVEYVSVGTGRDQIIRVGTGAGVL